MPRSLRARFIPLSLSVRAGKEQSVLLLIDDDIPNPLFLSRGRIYVVFGITEIEPTPKGSRFIEIVDIIELDIRSVFAAS